MKILATLMTSVYLWAIGLTLGALLACGVLSAPVIFKAYQYLPSLGVTSFDSGILMTEIFKRLNHILNGMAILTLVYELLAFGVGSKKSLFLLSIGILNAVLIFLFTMYYTPEIISAQQQGAAFTGTEDFENIHTQSEVVFKILFCTLSASFVWHIFNVCFSMPAQASKKRTRK